ncbi:formyltetrahydrofolate deformylase [Marinobacterium arenosum]|uniref:formyltetrahydrofolate deformylase n=1 Tax=Marinobacterium arenosum TaxID=2862496 RepID=UPI001C97E5F7|nr:formyltetrahydrofolate deformylase [Marinobacterium arenosum]MBY4678755.1 formyltetrahydrofolate deformylase [Marinobacterium arenosum]
MKDTAIANSPTYILTATCKSVLGTVDVVTRFLFERRCYITEMHTFDDSIGGNFFIRAEFKNDADQAPSLEELKQQFDAKAAEFEMDWQIRDASTPERVVIMVSKYDHCLQDLLYRYRTGHLNIEIPAIISNHPDLKELAEWHGIPYYHFPITAETKPQQEAKVMTVVENTRADLVVLARYMQVLSDDLCQKLRGRAINIHHSLLPGFKGAKPYHQAYDKGVKLVGATAHYVSPDLDEGPIITQGVEPVDHTYTPEQLVEKGRDTERLTLARALKLHCERRVFLDGNKTVVFKGG